MQELIQREEAIRKKNSIKNRPIKVMTVLTILVMAGMSAYLAYFIIHDSETVVANSANKRQDAFENVITRGKIETSDGTVIAESKNDENGNEVRVYPYSNMFSHIVGYNSYGRSGIELEENFKLMRSHVNVKDKFENSMSGKKNPGDNVITTLDFSLQQTAYKALDGIKGAVVAIEPDTGRILAMVSKPDYNPNDIDTVWNEVHSDTGFDSTVLLNRATQGLYAPGSTFKVLTTLEYLKEHPDDYQNYTYTCTGSGTFDNVNIRCSENEAHGTETLADSLANSCNTSYSNLGITENMDGLKSLCESALYNKKLPYELDSSKSQFQVDSSTDVSQIPQTVIGQGTTLVSPLHNALIMCAVANKGILMKPHLIDKIQNADGFSMHIYNSETYGRIFDEKLVSELVPMLKGVCEHGTAARFMAGKPYSVAGKTGTAETDSNGDMNSWFVGFSNVDNPDLVVAVLVEGYNQNQTSGTYIAGEMFDAYYNGRNE